MAGSVFRQLGRDHARPGGIVCVADHASSAVPEDIPLGIDEALLRQHIALDIGVEGLTERLARRTRFPAHIASVSRLVCDFNRDEADPAMVPASSDGHLIPGNIGADLAMRLDRFHRPYHRGLAGFIADTQPGLILALHSFTPMLASGGAPRPWQVGLLYNQDDRAAHHAIRLFGEQGLTVGDNQPYSGKQLNATMDRHAEAAGIPYCTVEIRQDLIATEADQARWAVMLADVMGRVALEV